MPDRRASRLTRPNGPVDLALRLTAPSRPSYVPMLRELLQPRCDKLARTGPSPAA
jgi:hypothetical protein